MRSNSLSQITSGTTNLARLLLLFVVLCSTRVCLSQTPEVLLNIAVLDERGVPVSGLRAEDFQITVDKVPQKVVSFRESGTPASIGVLIDSSASMFKGRDGEDQKKATVAGFNRFLQLSDVATEYFGMTFNSKTVGVEDWSPDISAVTTAITKFKSEGGTTIYDALSEALTKVTTGKHQKHVLILISDGQDNSSRVSFKRLLDRLKNSDVVLYCVGLLSGNDEGSSLGMEGQGVMDELASTGGGRAYFPHSRREYEATVASIAVDARALYQVRISPAPLTKNDWRRIRVKVSSDRPKIFVRFRQAFR